MSIARDIDTDFDSISRVIDLFLSSNDLQDLCKRLVHGELLSGECRGAHVFILNHKSNLLSVAGYGLSFATEDQEFSTWSENPASKSIREKKIIFTTQKFDQVSNPILSLPLMKEQTPLGCIVLIMAQTVTQNPLRQVLFKSLSNLGAYFLETHAALSSNSKPGAKASIEGLTTRQLNILGFISQGMTNAEIGAEILLSESTIRQETIRIYRSLGVNNRQDAILKGRSLGVIKAIS
jgi:DNA-binding CsgD family transcriptional regulator